MPHQIVRAVFERRDARGTFREIARGFPVRTVLCGHMEAGAVMGNHFHRHTRVFFYLTRGEATLRTIHVETGARDHFPLRESEGVVLEPGESHAIEYTTASDFVMLKSAAYRKEDPDTFPFPVPSGD